MKPSTLVHKEIYFSDSGKDVVSIDFWIDKVSLLQRLRAASTNPSDFTGCLVEGLPETNGKALARLALDLEPDTDRGAMLIYACPLCGDIGCGGFTMRVEKCAGGYVWKDFAFEKAGQEPAQPRRTRAVHKSGLSRFLEAPRREPGKGFDLPEQRLPRGLRHQRLGLGGPA